MSTHAIQMIPSTPWYTTRTTSEKFWATTPSKTRSKTSPGIARAMAEQWAGVCEMEVDEA